MSVNILLLAAEFPPMMWGGLANYSYNVARYLMKRNQVDVNVFPHGESMTNYVANLKFAADMDGKLWKRGASEKVDVVYAITFQPHFSSIGFCSRLLGVPFVSHGVGLDVYVLHPLYVFARRTAYVISDCIICGSEFQRRILVREGAPDRKVKVVLGGVDLDVFRRLNVGDEFRRKLGVEGKFLLLSLGRLEKRKGFDDVIRALTYLRDIPDIVLLIAGKGRERPHLEKLAIDLSLQDKVKFLGVVSSDDLLRIYNIADVFVAPFRSFGRDMEGFPLVVQEAQACGVPVVSTMTASLPELVENNKSGFLVPQSSPQALAEKIRILYEDAGLRKKMSENALRVAKSLLSLETATGKIESVLRKVSVSQ